MAGRDSCGDGAGDGKAGAGDAPLPGYIPWIFAEAEAEADAGWWERRRSNPKRMGELSQAAFLLKAQSLGFGLALPWGDSEKYDFIVWARPRGGCCACRLRQRGG
jgi:hypothetical protein